MTVLLFHTQIRRALDRPGSAHEDHNPGHKKEPIIILTLFHSEKSPCFINRKYTLPAGVLIAFACNLHAKAQIPGLGVGSLDLQMDSRSPYLFH